MENEKEIAEKVKLALVRGDSFGAWDSKLWQCLTNDFDITVFCCKRNIYNLEGNMLPIKKIFTSCDNFIVKQLFKYLGGQYKRMFGLQKQLASFNVALSYEVYNYYTLQTVRAKKYNKDLKVLINVVDNTIGRFEYNYWPGFKTPPVYWRKKIKEIIKEVVEGADMFLAVSDYSKEVLCDYGAPKEKIRILNPAVVMQSVIERQRLFVKLGLESDVNIYLSVNRLVKEKGVYEVLYAWKMYMYQSVKKNKTLLMIGSGPEKMNLQRLAKEWGMEKNIKIVSGLSNQEVRSLYGMARCLILASISNSVWQEQFGWVLAEAIICDCPVISTYSGAIPEMVENAGVLVPPGNPIEIRNALFKIDDEEFYSKLKSNCVKVKNKFGFEFFKNRLFGYFKELGLIKEKTIG